MDKKLYRIGANLPQEMGPELLAICRETGLSIQAFVASAVREKMTSYYLEKIQRAEMQNKLKELHTTMTA